jgi:hypothetical protein
MHGLRFWKTFTKRPFRGIEFPKDFKGPSLWTPTNSAGFSASRQDMGLWDMERLLHLEADPLEHLFEAVRLPSCDLTLDFLGGSPA